MLTLEDFHPLTLEDKPLFDIHYKTFPPIHSDNLFTTMISWMDYAQYHYAMVDDTLCIMTKIGNIIRFRPPIGKRSKTIADQVIHLAKQQDSDYPLGIIDEPTKDWLSATYPNLVISPHRDFFEYVYTAADLAELSGSAYAKIRNRLNKFTKQHIYTVEEIDKDDIEEVRKFLHRWCLWKDCSSDPFLEQEKKAILTSMDLFFELDLRGLAIRINGAIESIAIYEQMNSNTAVVHYEKGSPDYDGIYKAINAETAKILQEEVTFVNRESDMGIPGLRKAKLSYRPHHMVEVFHIAKANLL